MIETVCFVAGPLIQFGGAAIVMQTQDQWRTFLTQMFGVLVGGAITLGVNYYLQNRLFNAQNKERQIDRRMDAYSSLLRDILDPQFETRGNPYILRANLGQVSLHGSEEIKVMARDALRAIQNGTSNVTRQNGTVIDMRPFMRDLKGAMENELLQMKSPD